MKQYLREIVALLGIFFSVLLFTCTYAYGADAAVPANQKLFESKCAQCHGKDAKGNAKIAKVMKVDPALVDLTSGAAVTAKAEDLATIVSTGKGKMPKFKGKLTPDQITQVVQYVKSLQTAK